jgi:hypothetical protein
VRRWRGSLLALVVLLALPACSSSQEPAVRTTAAAFQRAVAGQDAATACALLSDEARTRLETASARPCPEALAALRLPADAVRSTEVWGGQAQARLGTDTLFLAELRDGWRVTAAGCTPREDQPYACRVRA